MCKKKMASAFTAGQESFCAENFDIKFQLYFIKSDDLQ